MLPGTVVQLIALQKSAALLQPRDVAYLFSDLQSPLAQRLGLLVLPSLSIQHGQVIQGSSNLNRQKERGNMINNLIYLRGTYEHECFPHSRCLLLSVLHARCTSKHRASVTDYFQAFGLTNHCFTSGKKKSIKTDRLEHETQQTVRLLPPCSQPLNTR